MKFPLHAGLAAAVLVMLAGCNDKSDTGEPVPADSGQKMEPAARDTGEPPSVPSATGSDAATPADQGPKAAAPAAVSKQTAPVPAPIEPPSAFLQCRACHSTEPGRNGVGPSLAGVVGRPAASAPGFRYSQALQASGIVWNRDKLDEWLSSPPNMVLGTRMVLSVRNAEQRQVIIDYLETLK